MKIVMSAWPHFIELAKLLAQAKHQIVPFTAEFAQILKNLDYQSVPLNEINPRQQNTSLVAAANALRKAKPIPTGSLSAGARKFATGELWGFLYSKLPMLGALAESLDQHSPDLIILHNDVEPQTRLAALWGKERGVPVLHVPHSAVYQDINRGDAGGDVHDLITATRLAAASNQQKKWYTSRGFPGKHIRVTGSPQFDKWATLNPNPLRARKLLGLELHTPTVTYASTWRQNTHLDGNNDTFKFAYYAFLEAVRDLPVQTIIKTHPNASGESTKWHIDAAKERGVKCAVTPAHLEVVLQATDMVIAFAGSNILLESAFLPHVRLGTIWGYETDEAVGKMDANADQIREFIVGSMSKEPKNTSEFLKKYVGFTDGGATKRIVDYVESLC